jgi:O-antigen/teichoic acid export membrane protein
MGIIIRQSVKSAIWSYLGVVIGYINVGIIMPQFFDTAQVGLVNLFASVSLIFAQFGTLGFTSVINRLFPVFRNPKTQHSGFLFLAILIGSLGFILCIAAFVILKPWVIETNIQKSPLVVEYLWLMMPLVLMRILFSLLDNYNKMLYDAVTGTFWMEFMHKVINLFLIVMFAFGWLNFSWFFTGYIVSMSLPVIPVIIVLVKRGNFNLKPQPGYMQKPLRREFGVTMVFGFINGMASVILVNVDRVFVNQYLSLNEVGIFGVCALFASLIRIPFSSISKIATGIIAEAWKRNDRMHIQEIYQKTAVNQAIIGTLIFVGIVVNLHNIFTILPPEYSTGKGVIVIYSAGMLFNSVLGLAGTITETSKYFRINTVFQGMVMISQFILSVVLIPRYGITGAAFATVSTFVLGASYQALFQRVVFGIYGANAKLLVIAGIGLLSYGAVWMMPHLSLLADIVIRSGLVTVMFLGLVYIFKLSPDMNSTIKSVLLILISSRIKRVK